MTYYKFLTAEGKGPFSGYQWPLPTKNDDGTWTPGDWVPPLEGQPRKCEHGYHLCTADQLIEWLNATLYEVEVSGCALVEEYDNKCATTAACRLVRQIEQCNERTLRLFACDCAEHVLHPYEKQYPVGRRVRECVEVARRYANGEATSQELSAARDAALAAARDAAGAAAWDAAGKREREWQQQRLCEMLGL